MKKIIVFLFLLTFVTTGCYKQAVKNENQKDIKNKIVNEEKQNETEKHNCSECTFLNNPIDTETEDKEYATKIDFNGNLDAQRYEAEILASIEKGPNFAKNFTIVELGCGSNCQAYMIVNPFTGKVENINLNATNGIKFDINSNLIIINPLENLVDASPELGKPNTTYYIIDFDINDIILNEVCTIKNN